MVERNAFADLQAQSQSLLSETMDHVVMRLRLRAEVLRAELAALPRGGRAGSRPDRRRLTLASKLRNVERLIFEQRQRKLGG